MQIHLPVFQCRCKYTCQYDASVARCVELQIWTFVCCHEFVVGTAVRQRGQKQHTGGFVIEALVNIGLQTIPPAFKPTKRIYSYFSFSSWSLFQNELQRVWSYLKFLKANVFDRISEWRYRNAMVCRYNVVIKPVCQLGNNLIEINFLKIGSHKSQPARLSNESSEN